MSNIKRSELSQLIENVTAEALEKNSRLLENQLVPTIELAIKLSCVANLKLFEKLGVIKIEED